eukprot:TRINITY_DN632_c0_g2_i1.p1 TRINITY_DN632_c0_g2~~TRINITY_DN632_c0_g2_i1.p1  ORF type:complete len:558 (+),score=161.47 TRINITY_DN632_c0_g2_i1:55-1674(+)
MINDDSSDDESFQICSSNNNTMISTKISGNDNYYGKEEEKETDDDIYYNDDENTMNDDFSDEIDIKEKEEDTDDNICSENENMINDDKESTQLCSTTNIPTNDNYDRKEVEAETDDYDNIYYNYDCQKTSSQVCSTKNNKLIFIDTDAKPDCVSLDKEVNDDSCDDTLQLAYFPTNDDEFVENNTNIVATKESEDAVYTAYSDHENEEYMDFCFEEEEEEEGETEEEWNDNKPISLNDDSVVKDQETYNHFKPTELEYTDDVPTRGNNNVKATDRCIQNECSDDDILDFNADANHYDVVEQEDKLTEIVPFNWPKVNNWFMDCKSDDDNNAENENTDEENSFVDSESECDEDTKADFDIEVDLTENEETELQERCFSMKQKIEETIAFLTNRFEDTEAKGMLTKKELDELESHLRQAKSDLWSSGQTEESMEMAKVAMLSMISFYEESKIFCEACGSWYGETKDIHITSYQHHSSLRALQLARNNERLAEECIVCFDLSEEDDIPVFECSQCHIKLHDKCWKSYCDLISPNCPQCSTPY